MSELFDKRDGQVDKDTVSTYSKFGASAYEDQRNREFLYGNKTVEFLKNVRFDNNCKFVLDIGCGTGFGFDELKDEFDRRDMKGLGIEPARGMLDIAIEKYKDDPRFEWNTGSFEDIPCEDKSVDKIISTLALHWVKDLECAAKEMARVLKEDGSLEILMIARDDGHYFKKAIVKAQRKHLTFAQIIKTAGLALRVSPEQCHAAMAVGFSEDKFDIRVEKISDIVYGDFEAHMKWWKARSTQIICDVKDKDRFMKDLQEELKKIWDGQGIPFDSNLLTIRIKGKK